MQRRRAPKFRRGGIPVPPPSSGSWRAAEPSSPSPPSRAPTEVPSLSTIALSSRSASTAQGKFDQGTGVEVELPYTLFEFGFPRDEPRPLPPSAQFTDPAGIQFMSSPAGQQLRKNERIYSGVVRQLITRSIRLAGSRVLVVGSGSSKEMLHLLNRGVASVVFIDVSQAALDRMRGHLDGAGLSATVEASYLCLDAWEYLSLAEEACYDLVIATKCLGLILGADPANRSVEAFLSMASDVLVDDGSLFCDHHLAFTAPDLVGRRVAEVVPPQHFDLATIAGRYDGDVCFSLDIPHDAFEVVATVSSPRADHLVQSWQLYHLRLVRRLPEARAVKIGTRKPPVPAEFSVPEPHPYDASVDSMLPINARGAKRVPTPSDVSGHDVSTARVKFNGVPGVLVLSEGDGLFMSSTVSFGLPLNRAVSPVLTLMAELVPVSRQTGVLAVTGLLAVGDVRGDPLDYRELETVLPVIDGLSPSGIMANTPALVRYLKGDNVVLKNSRGAEMRFPVDGVQVTTAGRNGVFIKPCPLNTIDAKPGEVRKLLEMAYDTCGAGARGLDVEGEDGEGVFEYSRARGTNVWRRLGARPDKARSDGVGSVVHTLFASSRSEELFSGDTVESVARAVLK